MENKELQPSRKDNIIGIWYAIAAFATWGILPVYWKILKDVPAKEILAHRIFWSFIFVSILLVFNGRWRDLKKTSGTRLNRLAVVMGAFLISANWGIYIWAVNNNHVVEASLGYYINPLLSVLLGVVVLKEKMNFWQLAAVFLAFLGVLIITVQYGKVPWIALSLSLTFGFYGLVKKTGKLDSISGLVMETAVVAPIALVYLIYLSWQGVGALGSISTASQMMLIGSGIVTALPLLWFARATKKISLSTVGFTQYIAPTISLFLGVFAYKEPFTGAEMASFGLIWCGLIVYSVSQTEFFRSFQPSAFKQSSRL